MLNPRLTSTLFRATVICLATTAAAIAPAEVLAPGVDYLQYNTADPNRVYVVKFERTRRDLQLQLGLPGKRRNYSARQTVSTIAAAYDAPPSNDVLAAVNGSFYTSGIGVVGGLASQNNIIQIPGPQDNFILTEAGIPKIIQNIGTTAYTLTFADSSTTRPDLFNATRQTNTMVAYTTDWGASTGTTAQGLEVIIQGVNYSVRSEKRVSGVVTQIREGAESLNNAIPPGSLVISARDARAADLRQKVAIGDPVELNIDLTDDFISNANMLITGSGWLLENGASRAPFWGTSSFETGRNPRTVIAWNATHIFLVAIDGRQAGVSVGMSFSEMASFLLNTLQATDAVNLDGGGSTTMVANGILRNRPSDGSERAVANAVMLVRDTVASPQISDSFPAIGRTFNWEDRSRYSKVVPFTPIAPGGDGYVLHVVDPDGGLSSVRAGKAFDSNYSVEAHIYFDYRPEDLAGDERYGIFARDIGNAAWDSSDTPPYGGGNCYAMVYSADIGRITMGRFRNGILSSLLIPTLTNTVDGWHKFRIECNGSNIRYLLDDVVKGEVTNTEFATGYAGIATYETYSDNLNITGVHADNFLFSPNPTAEIQDWTLY